LVDFGKHSRKLIKLDAALADRISDRRRIVAH
jgi:hypothetical protein